MRALVAALLCWAAPAMGAPTDWVPAPKVLPDGARLIEFTLERCLIKEAEGNALPLRATSAAKCETMNRATKAVRAPGLRTLRLPPGRYVFRVRNADVPWPVDLHVRGAQDKALPVAKGGAIQPGQVVDYTIVLVPGVYLYSAPLGGTYDYDLLVEK